MRFKAVFFDAGETLVHPHPSFPELFSEVLRAEGFVLEPKEVSDRIAVISDRFKQAALDNEMWSTSPERSKTFWLSIYRMFLDEVGLPSDGGLDGLLYEAFSDHTNYRLFDDVEPVLAGLHESDLTLGLVSNFEEWLEVLLERLDVTRYLPVRVISGVEGVEKPDPKIFEIALARAEVSASDAVYVGDNPVFDVEPAEAVGMFAVLLDRRNRHGGRGGARIESLADLPGLIGV